MIGKMSLLEIVQNILSSMDSDEVNSIGDTVESIQVAEVVRETFFEIFGNLSLPLRSSLVKLESLSNITSPNYLAIPEEVKSIDWFKYNFQENTETDFREVLYLDPKTFLERQVMNTLATSSFVTTDPLTGVQYPISTDRGPCWWTTFDNTMIACDSYNSSVDTTLQNSKSLAYGYIYSTFELDDLFVPDLDAQYFPLLLAEAKSSCFVNFKQVSNSKEEQRSKRQRMRVQNDLWKANQRRPYDLINYGRIR